MDRSTFQQRPLIFSSPNCAACRDYRTLARLYVAGTRGDLDLAEGGAV